ncbi:MAG: hypothetical protein WCP85_13105 [Mariniphaga sp.]
MESLVIHMNFLKWRISLIFASVCLMLNGCLQTEGTLEIKGKVIDDHTKGVLSGRKVVLQGLVYNDGELITKEAGQFRTDSTGHFTYSMKKSRDAYWYKFIFVGDSTYFTSTQKVPLVQLEKNSKYLSFPLNKLTGLSIEIERVSKAPLCDTLYVSWESNGVYGRSIYPQRINNFGVAPEIEYRWIGGKVKSEIETRVFANEKTIISFKLSRYGKKREVSDTVFCARDTQNKFSFKY